MKYRRVIIAVTVTCLSIPLAVGQEWPKEPIPARRIRDEIKAHDSGLAVWWTGHNGWLIKSDNLLIGTDLATEDEGRLYQSPITAAELAPLLDIAFITHKHGDHFNRKTAAFSARGANACSSCPPTASTTPAAWGFRRRRIQVAAPRKPMELKGGKVSPLRAIHGNRKSAVYFDANLEDCGYMVRAREQDVPPAGQTRCCSRDHLFLKHVDVLFFSPTEHNMLVIPQSS